MKKINCSKRNDFNVGVEKRFIVSKYTIVFFQGTKCLYALITDIVVFNRPRVASAQDFVGTEKKPYASVNCGLKSKKIASFSGDCVVFQKLTKATII